MAKVERLSNLVKKLQTSIDSLQAEKNKSVVVGYTQSYAVFVHENLQARHTVGQAKFLEQPARQLQGVLGEIIVNAVKKGATMMQGILLAGLRLQRESQKLCPVDTSALKNSAFTRVEDTNS